MLISIKGPNEIKPSEITPERIFRDRRRFLQTAAAAGAGLALGPALLPGDAAAALRGTAIKDLVKTPYGEGLKPTDYEAATSYNNFYEFGTGKSDPKANAGDFKPLPWTVEIAGEAAKTGPVAYEDIIKPHKLEERIYRFRCVEAWSMVVPWVGIPLGDVLKRFEPTSKAKYVAFETIVRPSEMPGQKRGFLKWPYVEGLRIDEAMHPLTLLTVGMYGETLPNQNGAPIRLMVPWKYGFKSIKSIVKITFTEKEPPTTWNIAGPQEYGFYSNVNPNVTHPRWSQAKERKIGDSVFTPKQDTLMFNGYADQVASLYAGMDLKKFY